MVVLPSPDCDLRAEVSFEKCLQAAAKDDGAASLKAAHPADFCRYCNMQDALRTVDLHAAFIRTRQAHSCLSG